MGSILQTEADDFRRSCFEAFGFLEDHGFRPGILTVDDQIHTVTVRFQGRVYAVECIWDARDDVVEAKIAQLQNGEPPKEFAVTPNGRRVRDHITRVLGRLGVRDLGFRKVPSEASRQDRWRTHLQDYARIIKAHGQAIIREDADLLEGVMVGRRPDRAIRGSE